MLKLSNVSLFSLLISIFKSPQELITHILLESDTRGELSPFPKHTEMHLSMFLLVHTNDSGRTRKKCITVSTYREGDYIHEKQRVRILKSC